MPSSPEKMLSPRQHRAFVLARQAAARILQRRVRLYRLIRRGYAKLSRNEVSMAQVGDDLRTLLRLARTWTRREYRGVPWRSVLYAVAAIVYFVNPVDLLPDAIAGLGFLDDVAVVGAVVNAIRKDLEAFKRWEGRQGEDPRLLPE